MSHSKSNRNHATIERWVKECGGFPATVKETSQNGLPGLLRIDFDGKDEIVAAD